MNNERAPLFLASLLLVAAWWTWNRAQAAQLPSGNEGQGQSLADDLQAALQSLRNVSANSFAAVTIGIQDTVSDTVNTVTGSGWEPPARAAPYLPAIYAAEDANGIPRNLLARLAYQESRYREDIISGSTVSPAGAKGLMQIVPRWHPNVDPLDTVAAINYAARYLAQLKAQTGSWPLALAAYNWGIGNLQAKGFGNAPRETRDYVAQITADVPVTA